LLPRHDVAARFGQLTTHLRRCPLLPGNWISLHEGQMHNEPSEEDSFCGSMATSSLHGEFEDPEVYAWEHRCPQHAETYSLAHFRERMKSVRCRMSRLLAAVELTPPSQNLSFLLPTLRAMHTELRFLLNSPGAWQDIHATDSELFSRAEAVLRKINAL
jgi:hypothetical protein